MEILGIRILVTYVALVMMTIVVAEDANIVNIRGETAAMIMMIATIVAQLTTIAVMVMVTMVGSVEVAMAMAVAVAMEMAMAMAMEEVTSYS